MKFYCEYCRSQIDAEKDKKCPSCKASYKDNKEYKKILEEKEKQNEQIKEQQEYIQKTFKTVGITSGIFALIVPLVAIGIIGTIIFIGVKEAKKNNNKIDDAFKNVEEKMEDQKETKEEKKVEPTVINQEKTSSDYKVKLEKYRILEQTKDKEFDKLEVTLIVEKISDKFSAWGEDFYCLVNNVSQEVDRFNSDMTTYIKDKNIPTSKKLTYYVPKNITSFDIKYGNEISFHVDIKSDNN